jgi:hypothetical protein
MAASGEIEPEAASHRRNCHSWRKQEEPSLLPIKQTATRRSRSKIKRRPVVGQPGPQKRTRGLSYWLGVMAQEKGLPVAGRRTYIGRSKRGLGLLSTQLRGRPTYTLV